MQTSQTSLVYCNYLFLILGLSCRVFWNYCCIDRIPEGNLRSVADPENFGGGGFEAKTSKIRMSSPKLRLIFRPKSEIQTFFLPKIRWSPKKKKKKRSSPKLRLIFRPKSEIQTFFLPKIRWSPKKKKKKKVFTKIETDFSAGFVTFRSVGGNASRNGAELFKIRADFSAKIVTPP